MLQAAATAHNGLNHLHFNAELVPIQVDNCCFKCITNDNKDLVPALIKKTMKKIRGFKGEECAATCQGTIHWSLDNDQGLWHTFFIPNSYFVPQAMSRLLCSQHWAQEAANHSPIRYGTSCNTNDCCVTLYWAQCTKKRTVPLDPTDNVGILYTSTGYGTNDSKWKAMEAIMVKRGVLCCCNVGFLPPDNKEEEEETLPVPTDKDKEQIVEERWPIGLPQQDQPMNFDLQGPANDQSDYGQIDIDEENNNVEPLPARMLCEHHRLAHLLLTWMRAMAWVGLLPKSFAECCTPMYTACLYGKSTKRPWRTKGDDMTGALKQVTYPGQCVVVD